jgi:hypothetical protein
MPKIVRATSYNPKIVTAYFREHGIPEPVYEYKFCPTRRWRFDLAWPVINFGQDNPTPFDGQLAIEVQGGIFVQGGHNRGAQMRNEHEKRNKAACMGWRILYVEPQELCMASTVLLIKEAFGWL